MKKILSDFPTRTFAASVLLVFFSAGPASAGSVSGTVVDAATGKPLIAAQVSAILQGEKNPEVKSSVDSDLTGHYSIENLPAGTYAITATLQGYRPAAEKNILVSDAAPATANLKSSRLGH